MDREDGGDGVATGDELEDAGNTELVGVKGEKGKRQAQSSEENEASKDP